MRRNPYGWNFVDKACRSSAALVWKALSSMSSEVSEILDEQRQKFIDEYGREPGPNDPVFFDMPPLEHVEHEMVQAMNAAGLDPVYI
jgi:hypothetical protein